jgi:hypothetical protein
MSEPHENFYPKAVFPNFDMNNYRIIHIMIQYKYLNEERETRNNF